MATVTEEAAPAVAVEATKPDEGEKKVDEVPKPVEEEKKVEDVLKPVEEEKKVEEEAPDSEEGEGKKAVEGDQQGKKAEKKQRKRKPRSAGPHHPPYFEMIKEAILALDGKSGSSPYAIAKYMGEKHRDVLPANYRKVLAVQLRNFAAKGKLVKVKASFKLGAAEEKKKAVPTGKKAAPAAKRKRTARAPAKKMPVAAASAPKEAKKARAKRARKAAPAPAQPQPKQHKAARAAGTKRGANKASA